MLPLGAHTTRSENGANSGCTYALVHSTIEAGLGVAGFTVTGDELAGAGAEARGDEPALGVDLPLHAARPAAASATALMVRAARPSAASGAARRARESRLPAITVISPMSGLPEGKDGTRPGPVFTECRSRPTAGPRSC
jgi:hypothetical protein